MMAGVGTSCEECGGQRFEAAVLDHPLGGRTIAEVLAMSAAEAWTFFAEAAAHTPAAHTGGVHILAEPPTDLDLADVEQMLGLLDRLVDSGRSVIALEHLAACSAGNPGAREHR